MANLARRESELLLYTALDGAVKVGVLFKDETAWLTQKTMAELFGVGVPAINKHLKNIFESGELDAQATISKMEMVRSEGGREVVRQVELYNLDAITAPCSTGRGFLMLRVCCSTLRQAADLDGTIRVQRNRNRAELILDQRFSC